MDLVLPIVQPLIVPIRALGYGSSERVLGRQLGIYTGRCSN